MLNEPVFGIPGDVTHGPSYSTLSAVPETWAMKTTSIDRIRELGRSGEGEVIAVLDTGATSSHPEFPAERWHALPWSDVPGESPDDRNGHGTHVMGTAAGSSPTIGVANRAKLLSGKCLSNSGSGSNSWIRSAYKRACDKGATFISMSLGGPGFLESMEDLFREADAAGIVTVVAAGNGRQGGEIAVISTALVIAAVDMNGRYAPFSTPGMNNTTLTVAAPGVDIVSAKPGGGYQSMSGTSMATPFVAGVVAVVQSGCVSLGLPRLNCAGFKQLFGSRAVDAGTPGIDRDYGPGLIDCQMLRMYFFPDPKPL